ncbi:MAG: hypothetical protein AAF253_07100 [Pseudomonadota bacterium]
MSKVLHPVLLPVLALCLPAVAGPAVAEVKFDTGPIERALEMSDRIERDARNARLFEAEPVATDAVEICSVATGNLDGASRADVFETCLEAVESGRSVGVRRRGNASIVYASPGSYACSVIGERGRSCRSPVPSGTALPRSPR